MAMSVLTNKSALLALQNLNATTEKLGDAQNKINTGLKVAGAKDNAAVYAIAQGQRADTSALAAVKMSLDRATSLSDVALTAGQSISDILVQMKEKVAGASDPSATVDSRKAFDDEFTGMLDLLVERDSLCRCFGRRHVRLPVLPWSSLPGSHQLGC